MAQSEQAHSRSVSASPHRDVSCQSPLGSQAVPRIAANQSLRVRQTQACRFQRKTSRTDPRRNKTKLVVWLEQNYFPTLHGSPGLLKAKQRIIAKVRAGRGNRPARSVAPWPIAGSEGYLGLSFKTTASAGRFSATAHS